MSNISQYLSAILSARYGKDVRQSIHDAIQTVDSVADTARDSATASAAAANAAATDAEDSAVLAADSEANASKSASAAAASASNADRKANEAAASAANAAASETTAADKAGEASDSAAAAKTFETNAANSKAAAATSAAAASDSADAAEISAASSAQSATTAAGKAGEAGTSADLADQYADLSQSYAVGTDGAVREGDSLDNAKYYKEQAERIAEGLKGSLLPMGTIAFADLPDKSTAGYMYNISDEFTTTARFKEGAGHVVSAGTNVYYTADGYWDCMAGSPVSSVNGQRGNITITPENIGALPADGNAVSATKATQDGNGSNIVDTYQTKTGNTANNSVTFTSGDSASPTGWTDVDVVKSGEKHSSLLAKISTMIKNVRWLYKMLGTTDISALGGGTVTGAISALNVTLAQKQASVTGGASTITSSNMTANRALVSNASGKVAVSAVTSTELGYLDGVTGNVQTQLNNKMICFYNGSTYISKAELHLLEVTFDNSAASITYTGKLGSIYAIFIRSTQYNHLVIRGSYISSSKKISMSATWLDDYNTNPVYGKAALAMLIIGA